MFYAYRMMWHWLQWRWRLTLTLSQLTQWRGCVTSIMNTLQIANLWPTRSTLRSVTLNCTMVEGIERKNILKQVSCILECRMKKTLINMKDDDRCLPWYYPPVDLDTRLCTPFEAGEFNRLMELISANECRVQICILICYVMNGTWNVKFLAMSAKLQGDSILC